VIAFNPAVLPLAIDVQDPFTRQLKLVHLANHTDVAMCFVGCYCARLIDPRVLTSLLQKSPCRFDVPARGEAKVDQLSNLINCPPKVAPLSADADVGFSDMPVQATPSSVFERAFRYLRAKLAYPTVNCGGTNIDAALCQKISHVPAGERVSAIPTHGTQDNIGRKPMVFEGVAP